MTSLPLSQPGGVTQVCDLSSGLLALAGGRALEPGERTGYQALLGAAQLPPGLPLDCSVQETAGQALPQTDLTRGLLQSLAAPAPPSLPQLTAALRPGPVLLALLARLPTLAAYRVAWMEVQQGGAMVLPPLRQEQVAHLAKELALATSLLALPLYGPVAPEQVAALTSLALGALLAALGVALSSTSVYPDTSVPLVGDALALMDTVAGMVKTSTRLGAAVEANLGMASCYLLVQGLQPLLASCPPFSPPLALLTERLLMGLGLLLADLSPEEQVMDKGATLAPLGEFSGRQRCSLVLERGPLPRLVLHLAHLSFCQARASLQGEAALVPDILVPGSGGQEEEEPILGVWMQGLLAPGPITLGQGVSEDGSVGGQEVGVVEASPASTSCLALSSSLLAFLSSGLSSPSTFLHDYFLASLSPELVSSLASLITVASLSPMPSSLPAWPSFSLSLSTLAHALVAAPLPPPLTTVLLEKLGLAPESPGPWPLAAPRRALAVLAQILLTRQASEAASPLAVTSQYVAIWERAVASMAAAATSVTPQEDTSVASLHLLLLLFHSLQLMQKKTVLVAVSRALTTSCCGAPVPTPSHTCLHLARLALLLDYLVRHLYEPPASLLPLIRANLFSLGSLHTSPSAPILPELEGEDSTPYFLLLPPPPGLQGPEVPRLDGLALSFLLSTPEMVDYPALHAALLSCIQPALTSEAGRPALYCFLALWRLLQALPPPAPLLRSLLALATRAREEEDRAPPPDYGLTLHTLVLAPKAAHRNFGAWVRDCLVKQGLETGEAEALVQGVATRVASSRSEVALMRAFLQGLEARGEATLQAADLALLDCMMARIHLSLERVLSNGALPSPTSSPGPEDWEEGDTPELALQAAHTLVPAVARLLATLGRMARAQVLDSFLGSCEKQVEPATRASLLHSISLAGTRCPATASLALPVTAHLPPALRCALEDWAAAPLTAFPPASAWRSGSDASPPPGDEGHLSATLAAHSSFLAVSNGGAVPPPALKHALFSATRFACDLLLWCPDSSPLQQRLVSALFPLLLDCTTEHLADLVTLSLERLVGTGETEEFLASVHQLVLQHAYPILTSRAAAQPSLASLQVPQELLRFTKLKLFTSNMAYNRPNVSSLAYLSYLSLFWSYLTSMPAVKTRRICQIRMI